MNIRNLLQCCCINVAVIMLLFHGDSNLLRVCFDGYYKAGLLN